MKSRKLCSLTIVLILALAVAAPAWADSYHYKNILVGDRASGLGGAYTAIADDPSGVYYNPAGLVYSSGTNVSASANAYHNTTKEYGNVLAGRGWERNASKLLPNFFGVAQKAGNGRIGLAYVVPDTVLEDQDQRFFDLPSQYAGVGITDYALNFNNEDSTHYFGVAYAREINEKLSWGMTLFYHHRRIQTIMNQVKTYDNGESMWSNFYYESEEDGLRPMLGVMWTPAEKYSFGVSVAKTFITGSRTTVQESRKDYQSADADVSYANSGEEREYPLNINIGGAYFASDIFLVSADINYFTAEKDKIDIEKTWLTNFAIGTEYYYSPTMALRAGIYSNMSSAPEIKSGILAVTEDDVDMYGLSFSASHFGRGSSLTGGLAYAWGSGDAQVTDDVTQIQPVDITSWTVYLSNSYGF